MHCVIANHSRVLMRACGTTGVIPEGEKTAWMVADGCQCKVLREPLGTLNTSEHRITRPFTTLRLPLP